MLTGDVHGDMSISRLDLENVRSKGLDPAKIDYLIVLGDWGVIWNSGAPSVRLEKELLAEYDAMPWETLVILGNHEGYDRILRLRRTERHGGPVRQVTDKVFIL